MSDKDVAELQQKIWSGDIKGLSAYSAKDAKTIAEALVAAGYRAPKVIGYIVVDRTGHGIRSHETRAAAEAMAFQWTWDCKNTSIDWDYRVAEIVEVGQ